MTGMELMGKVSKAVQHSGLGLDSYVTVSGVLTGMELMGKSQRRFNTVAFKSCEILMTLLATLFAYLLRHWSHFQASLAAPCIFVLFGYL